MCTTDSNCADVRRVAGRCANLAAGGAGRCGTLVRYLLDVRGRATIPTFFGLAHRLLSPFGVPADTYYSVYSRSMATPQTHTTVRLTPFPLEPARAPVPLQMERETVRECEHARTQGARMYPSHLLVPPCIDRAGMVSLFECESGGASFLRRPRVGLCPFLEVVEKGAPGSRHAGSRLQDGQRHRWKRNAHRRLDYGIGLAEKHIGGILHSKWMRVQYTSIRDT